MLQTVLGGIREGYTMHVAADACAEATTYIHDVAIQRMVQAGAVPLTTFSLAAELQVDQALPSGTIFAELTG